MCPITAVELPDRAPSSRKYSEQDGSGALDLLREGKVAGDGAEYEKEDQARSSGNSLKRAISGAAVKRGIEPPTLTVKVREKSPGAFVFGVAVKQDADAADDDADTGNDAAAKEKAEKDAAAKEKAEKDAAAKEKAAKEKAEKDAAAK